MVTTNKFEFPIGREGQHLGSNMGRTKETGDVTPDDSVRQALLMAATALQEKLSAGAEPITPPIVSAADTITGAVEPVTIGELYSAFNGTQGFTTTRGR